MTDEQTPNEDRLRELLVGRSVVRAEMGPPVDEWDRGPSGTLTLSDGTVLRVWGNDGGCACDAGCYPLASLNEVGNVITNVEVEARPDSEDATDCTECDPPWDCKHRGWYRIFVYAEDRRIPLASFEGSDGNGYYGTGWWLRVESGASA